MSKGSRPRQRPTGAQRLPCAAVRRETRHHSGDLWRISIEIPGVFASAPAKPLPSAHPAIKVFVQCGAQPYLSWALQTVRRVAPTEDPALKSPILHSHERLSILTKGGYNMAWF